jgi:hypothetical protein
MNQPRFCCIAVTISTNNEKKGVICLSTILKLGPYCVQQYTLTEVSDKGHFKNKPWQLTLLMGAMRLFIFYSH